MQIYMKVEIIVVMIVMTCIMIFFGGKRHKDKTMYDCKILHNFETIEKMKDKLKTCVRTNTIKNITKNIYLPGIANVDEVYVMYLMPKQSLHILDDNSRIYVLLNHNKTNIIVGDIMTNKEYIIVNSCLITNDDIDIKTLSLITIKKPY